MNSICGDFAHLYSKYAIQTPKSIKIKVIVKKLYFQIIGSLRSTQPFFLKVNHPLRY